MFPMTVPWSARREMAVVVLVNTVQAFSTDDVSCDVAFGRVEFFSGNCCKVTNAIYVPVTSLAVNRPYLLGSWFYTPF